MRRSQFIGANGQLMRQQPKSSGTANKPLGGTHRPQSATRSSSSSRTGVRTTTLTATAGQPLSDSTNVAGQAGPKSSNLSSSLSSGALARGSLRPSSAQRGVGAGGTNYSTKSTPPSNGKVFTTRTANQESSPRGFLNERNFVKPLKSEEGQKKDTRTPASQDPSTKSNQAQLDQIQLEQEQRRAVVDSFLFGGAKKPSPSAQEGQGSATTIPTAPRSPALVSGESSSNGGGAKQGLFSHRKVKMDFTSPTAQPPPPQEAVKPTTAAAPVPDRVVEAENHRTQQLADRRISDVITKQEVSLQRNGDQSNEDTLLDEYSGDRSTNSSDLMPKVTAKATTTVKKKLQSDGQIKCNSASVAKPSSSKLASAPVKHNSPPSIEEKLSPEVARALQGKEGLGARKGEYHQHFAKMGYYACRKCRLPVFSVGSKVPAEGGFATFVKHYKPSLQTNVSLTAHFSASGGVAASALAFLEDTSSSASTGMRLTMSCTRCSSFIGQVTHSDSPLVQETAHEAETQKTSSGSVLGSRGSSFFSAGSIRKSKQQSTTNTATNMDSLNNSSDLIQVNSFCIIYIPTPVADAYRGTEGVVDVGHEVDDAHGKEIAQKARIKSWGMKRKGKTTKMVDLDADDWSSSEGDESYDDANSGYGDAEAEYEGAYLDDEDEE